MIKNYFSVVLRTIKKNRLTTTLNLLGLIFSITSFLLIIVYIGYEHGYDKFHAHAGDIYRISTRVKTDASDDQVAWAHGFLGSALLERFEEVENAVRFSTFQNKFTVRSEEQIFIESRFCYAEHTLFQFFTYNMVSGNPDESLNKPNSIVLTRDLALKYFSSVDEAVGKILEVNGKDYSVTGVVENPPGNSDFTFTAALSVDSRQIDEVEWAFTYVLMRHDADLTLFREKLASFTQEQVQPHFDQIGAKVEYLFEPLLGLHLTKPKLFDTPKSNPVFITILSIVAVLILVMAIVNYVSLSIASSVKKSLELGARKVFGASRKQAVSQFSVESVIICFSAIVVSFGLVIGLLPLFNQTLDISINLSHVFTISTIAFVFAALAILIFIASIYYWFYMASLGPLELLRGDASTKRSNTVRKVMVVVQFTTSITMVMSSLLIYNQMSFLFSTPLGFDKEQVLVIELLTEEANQERMNTLRAALLGNPKIAKVGFSQSNSIPGNDMDKVSFTVDSEEGSRDKIFDIIKAGPGYIDALDISIVAGRDFTKDPGADSVVRYLVNEAMVKTMGWKDPIGLEMESEAYGKGQVAGVVKDFNFKSFYQQIEPVVITFNNEAPENLMVKIKPGNIQETLDFIKKQWQSHLAGEPFDFYFLDDSYFRQYKKDIAIKNVFLYFTVLTLIVAFLGLFGLSFYSSQMKLKEVSIRKLLGANDGSVVQILFKEYIFIFFVAHALAIPASIYIIQQWLTGFAYRSAIQASAFVLSAVLAMIVIVISTSYHILKVIRSKPVDVLRNE